MSAETKDKYKIITKDREAAWAYKPECYTEEDREKWMRGLYDDAASIIRGFARHRIESEPQRNPNSPDFAIGDKVKILYPGFENDDPHFITGIDWDAENGVTYTTSEVWPPKHSGDRVFALTDGWTPGNLRLVSKD
jgi:hypothetical protein